MKKFHYVIGGGITYMMAVGVGYRYANSLQKSNESFMESKLSNSDIKLTDNERNTTYNSLASKYDAAIGFDEVLMGLTWIRWWHLRKSHGDVLEVGCGTGRNFENFDVPNVNTITAIDYAPSMIATATTKLKNNQLLINSKKLKLYEMNAHQLEFSDNSFDTVVDTFGLCSYEDPIMVLKEMSRVCRKSGKILLIEHGKGSYDWINTIIDQGACAHAHKWGCSWNRDIKQLISDSELDIISCNRWHFGTTYVIEAKPICRK